MMKKWMSVLCVAIILASCSGINGYEELQQKIEVIVNDKDARIGVALIIDGKDTVGVNMNEDFPMLSVYKFPIALACGEYCRQNGTGLDYRLSIFQEDMLPDTYSPMRDRYAGVDSMCISLEELLAYSLQESDNNASDIILKYSRGAGAVQSYVNALGCKDIFVCSSEAEMHKDNQLCYKNSSTPLAMAELLDKFDREFTDSVSMGIKRLMETCSTGVDRLAAPLKPMDAILGHKTGTGFTLDDGRLMALNDAGYVHLQNGCRYTIAVFIAEADYNVSETSAIIAEISRVAAEYLSHE